MIVTTEKLKTSPKWERISDTMREYSQLKAIFLDFVEGLKEKYSQRCVQDETMRGVVLKFVTPLDTVLVVEFSMVVACQVAGYNIPFGKITFAKQEAWDKSPELYWEVLFDENRHLREHMERIQVFDYLLTKENAECLIIDALDKLIDTMHFPLKSA